MEDGMCISRASPIVWAAVMMAATPAPAETWICSHSDRKPLVIFSMDGELRVGEPPGLARFAVLQNNPIAVIAVHHDSTTNPASNSIELVIATVLIDKRSNKSIYTITRNDGESRQLKGHCRGYDEGLENSSPIITFFPH